MLMFLCWAVCVADLRDSSSLIPALGSLSASLLSLYQWKPWLIWPIWYHYDTFCSVSAIFLQHFRSDAKWWKSIKSHIMPAQSESINCFCSGVRFERNIAAELFIQEAKRSRFGLTPSICNACCNSSVFSFHSLS